MIDCMTIHDGRAWCRLRKAADKRSQLPCDAEPCQCPTRAEAERKESAAKNGGSR